MEPILKESHPSPGGAVPLCPVFGECMGCVYQDVAYPLELKAKEQQLKSALHDAIGIPDGVYSPIVPSPKPYHYRNRIDLKLKRTKEGDILIGFTPVQKRGVLPVEACFIAEENISRFIPELKKEAVAKIPPKYRVANLVVRTGDDGRVLWGGIGRRSCALPPEDYLWAEIGGRKIFYSLDTFFQANLSILPELFKVIGAWDIWGKCPVFYDLYGGVGLFGIGLRDYVRKVFLIEENPASLKLARHNRAYNRIDAFEVVDGKVEDKLPGLLNINTDEAAVALIDPPRAGLSGQACTFISGMRGLDHIIYLSCSPESLARDLKQFMDKGWAVRKIIPFDFFPKTKHLETLVLLESPDAQRRA